MPMKILATARANVALPRVQWVRFHVRLSFEVFLGLARSATRTCGCSTGYVTV